MKTNVMKSLASRFHHCPKPGLREGMPPKSVNLWGNHVAQLEVSGREPATQLVLRDCQETVTNEANGLGGWARLGASGVDARGLDDVPAGARLVGCFRVGDIETVDAADCARGVATDGLVGGNDREAFHMAYPLLHREASGDNCIVDLVGRQ